MRELYRSNDMVEISYLSSLLEAAGIGYMVSDQHMSVLEGSIGVLPRRVLVDETCFARAQALVQQMEDDKAP